MKTLLIVRRLETAAATPPIKGTRVAVKYGPNEWYLGTVVRSGAKITVAFDDGSQEAHPWSALKIKAVGYKRVRKTAITDEQVKSLLATPAKVSTPQQKRKVVKAPKELAHGKGQLYTDSQGNQFLILARTNTWNNQDAGVRYELHEKLAGADRKFHKKSVSTYTLTAMQQSVSGRMQELGTKQVKVEDVDGSLLMTAQP